MTSYLDHSEIKKIISEAPQTSLMEAIEIAFTSYSNGQSVVPPVGTLSFENPPADVHIKYGYIREDKYYVIKIASGFYENPAMDLSSSNGLNLVFNQKTGLLETILLDQGYLTDIRTAVAGAIVAKHLAPPKVERIGIVGTGIQARLQLKYLKDVVDCNQVTVWGRSQEKLEAYQREMAPENFEIEITQDHQRISKTCNLIITVTPSTVPILFGTDLKPGTLITAMGADTKGKQELDFSVLRKADLIVVDSPSQCQSHGEIHKAYQQGLIGDKKITELGEIISAQGFDRIPSDIIVADLTGIATQDIQISKFVLDHQ